MVKGFLSTVASLLVLAKIVIAGCSTHSFTTCDDGIVHWFDPNTGEICDPLDCGGGRAPPKTNVPGCAGYTGTYVPTTSYLSCWTPSASATSTPATVSSAESTTDTVATGKSSPTSPSTTTSTATQVATDSSTTPSTTMPPSQSSNSTTHGNGTSSTSGTAAQSSPTNNKGNMLDGSLIAVAGAAIGAVALI